jgi:mannose-6-phosphate isomerase-like protein (cupin superfamily)
MSDRPRPQVFPLSERNARPNNPTASSVRVVTPEATGQSRLYAGAFWSQPGSEGGWAFVGEDPAEGTMADGIPHLGDHDEVYLCLRGRCRIEWDGGTFEFGANDIVHFPAGYTYRSWTIGDEPLHVFWVMSPAPGWMAPLKDREEARGG